MFSRMGSEAVEWPTTSHEISLSSLDRPLLSLCQGSRCRPANLHQGTDHLKFALAEDSGIFCIFVEDVVVGVHE